MKSEIWLSSPHMGGMEKRFVEEAFLQNWIAPMGPDIIKFEESLADYTGVGYAVALSSGTSAIHLGLQLLGVMKGDEVICQSLTFVATANPVMYLGATPVFVDSEKGSWNMDPEALEAAIKDRLAKGKKVKAIIPVHLYGMPAKMDAILEIAERYEIPVLEDAAESLGSRIGAKQTGKFGHLAVVSFNGNKIITTSGGGALLSDSEEYINKARFLATQAKEEVVHYEHKEMGYNYRMSNISACIGRGQMLVLDERIQQRRKNFDFYIEQLDFSGISFQHESEKVFSNRWLTAIQVNPELTGVSGDEIRLALLADNIESRPVWKPMHMQPLFQDCAYYGNQVAEELYTYGLCLPSGSNLTTGALNRVGTIIKGMLKHQNPRKQFDEDERNLSSQLVFASQ
ncbi:aminotransferase class I/II-fold pyridoxal phosphate-dependent enzyme [Desertivirga xinjiangensis]|uniref:aminotransferase class I/II-fold pyridoxal phosphate-dependent enzyme n=1 Tax=Desertivirga xinjiangensis TaxID=539206 RepID=UPI00272EC00A|nr:aminotransferase class I/II-fold pyridoxal phosphate-dependent enzyme [Pedobacter xinjiangensis]